MICLHRLALHMMLLGYSQRLSAVTGLQTVYFMSDETPATKGNRVYVRTGGQVLTQWPYTEFNCMDELSTYLAEFF